MRIWTLLLLLCATLNSPALECRSKPFGELAIFNLAILNGNFNDPKTADRLIKEAIKNCRIDNKNESETMFIYERTDGLLSYRGSDTQGKMLVSGNVYLKNYSVGHSEFYNTNKIVANGKVVILPDTNTDRLGHLFGQTNIYGSRYLENQNFPTSTEANRLIKLSHDLFNLKNTGKILSPYLAKIELVGDNSSPTQVFSISGESLFHIREIYFSRIPKDATIIVNIKAPKKLTQLTGYIDLNVQNNKTLFNFEASERDYSVHVHNVEVPGSIIAPTAKFFFSTGLVRGQIISKDFTGSGQINLSLFDGCLPASSTDGPPCN